MHLMADFCRYRHFSRTRCQRAIYTLTHRQARARAYTHKQHTCRAPSTAKSITLDSFIRESQWQCAVLSSLSATVSRSLSSSHSRTARTHALDDVGSVVALLQRRQQRTARRTFESWVAAAAEKHRLSCQSVPTRRPAVSCRPTSTHI